MQITTRHPASKFGYPVILVGSTNDVVLDQVHGLSEVLARLKWSRAHLADMCGVSPRTVEQWFQLVDGKPRRTIPAACLNVLADALHLQQGRQ